MATLMGRVAVVTGGGRGIGAATAIAIAREGAAVAVMARSASEVAQVAAKLAERGARSLAVPCDVADPIAIAESFATIARTLGPVDVLINNAGVVTPLGPTVAVDLDAWRAALAINLVGAFACIKAVLPGMLERGWGRIVNVSTGAATGSGMGNANAYSVSKAGLEMLTMQLAAELAGSGVTVNAIRPGTVDTAMQLGIRESSPAAAGAELVSRFQDLHAQGRLIDPALPATLIARLLAQEGTGEIVGIGDARGQALLAAG